MQSSKTLCDVQQLEPPAVKRVRKLNHRHPKRTMQNGGKRKRPPRLVLQASGGLCSNTNQLKMLICSSSKVGHVGWPSTMRQHEAARYGPLAHPQKAQSAISTMYTHLVWRRKTCRPTQWTENSVRYLVYMSCCSLQNFCTPYMSSLSIQNTSCKPCIYHDGPEPHRISGRFLI